MNLYQPPSEGPVIDGVKYVAEAIIVGTFGLSPAEVADLARGNPILVRSAIVEGQTYYAWADALLVSSIMTRIDREEADPAC